jgi:hypothetical protein
MQQQENNLQIQLATLFQFDMVIIVAVSVAAISPHTLCDEHDSANSLFE